MKIHMIVLPITLALISLSISTGAQSDSSLNGFLWSKVPFEARIFWLAGHDSGFTSGLRMAASFKSFDNKDGAFPKTARDSIILRNLLRYGGTNPRILSNQVILDEMSLFYKDFRNAPVCWANAEPIAELALTIGAPSETELIAIRSEDTKDGCDLGFPSK